MTAGAPSPPSSTAITAITWGYAAYSLLANGATGYMAAIKDLHKPVTEWRPIGIPLAPLMHLEERKGRLELVIAKQKVDLEAPAFKFLEQERQKWAHEDHYRFPGPIQFEGPAAGHQAHHPAIEQPGKWFKGWVTEATARRHVGRSVMVDKNVRKGVLAPGFTFL